MKILLHLLLPILILGAGYFGMKALSVDPAEAEAASLHGKSHKKGTKKDKPKKTTSSGYKPTVSMRKSNTVKTKVKLLEKTDYQVKILSEGIVTAHHLTSLTSRVNGRVVRVSNVFESGGFFNNGEVLIEIDATDFQSSLASASARLAQAEATVAQEEARARQAKLNWEDIGYEDEPSDLVLRKPQLKEARAKLLSAQADLDKSQRDLERTKIRAPYAGCVKSRNIGIGQSVGPSTKLGEIFSTEFAEIRFPVSPNQLPMVNLPANLNGEKGQKVIIKDALGIHPDAEWHGELVRSEGVIDEASRELYLVARVADPYRMSPGTQAGQGRTAHKAQLRVGQPVRITLNGRILSDVYEIPRAALSGPAEVILLHPEELTINRQEITAIWEDADALIIRDQLPEGHLLATSRISQIPRGATVEIIEEEPASEKDSTEAKLTQKKEGAAPSKEKS